MFVLTGTRDKGLEGAWEWRAQSYGDMPAGCKWLGVIDGATHMNFAGVGFAGKTEKLTLSSIDAFLEGAGSGKMCIAAVAGWRHDEQQIVISDGAQRVHANYAL